jgi:hypothetical protein
LSLQSAEVDDLREKLKRYQEVEAEGSHGPMAVAAAHNAEIVLLKSEVSE